MEAKAVVSKPSPAAVMADRSGVFDMPSSKAAAMMMGAPQVKGMPVGAIPVTPVMMPLTIARRFSDSTDHIAQQNGSGSAAYLMHTRVILVSLVLVAALGVLIGLEKHIIFSSMAGFLAFVVLLFGVTTLEVASQSFIRRHSLSSSSWQKGDSARIFMA